MTISEFSNFITHVTPLSLLPHKLPKMTSCFANHCSWPAIYKWLPSNSKIKLFAFPTCLLWPGALNTWFYKILEVLNN